MGRILLVDDSPELSRLLAHKFSMDGHQVEVARDGPEGLEKTKTFSPDLIILDVMMPGMNGYQVLAALREDPETTQLPIIMLTSLADDKSVVRGLRGGASDYVVKPFSTSELSARVARLLAA
jgi:two-component system alkaline phosphatase synthesis response regulator PhoP